MNAAGTDTPAFKPLGFDLDEWLARGGDSETFGDGRLQDLRLLCTHRRASLWQYHAIGQNQRIVPGADKRWIELRADVVDSIELRRYLLSLGSEVRILEPDAIRSWLELQARALTAGRIEDQSA